MGDQYKGVRIIAEVILQPVAGFEVEMIGGLVEEEKIGLLQEEFGEGDAHLPAAGKFFGLAGPVVAPKAKPGEDFADFGFERVAVARAEFMLEFLVAVGDGGILLAQVVELGHVVGEGLHLFFHGVEIVEDRHALGKDGATGEGEAVLREVAGGNAPGARDGAIVERFKSAEDFHDGGFAGAVGADEADAGLRRDEPVGIFEEQFVAVTLAGG